MPLDQPLAVVPILELQQGQAKLLPRLELPQPEQLLLQRPDEPLGASVALGLAHERRAGVDPEEPQLLLEQIRQQALP